MTTKIQRTWTFLVRIKAVCLETSEGPTVFTFISFQGTFHYSLYISFLWIGSSLAPLCSLYNWSHGSHGGRMSAWVCTCGFRNRAQNAVCGGTGPLGCKKDRTTPSATHDGAESAAAAYETEALPPRCTGTLRLVTYNVCFHPSDLDIRLKAIAQILEFVDADIVALQEITDRILDTLTLHISKEWRIFKQSPSHVEDLFVYETGYFTCLLVKACVQVVDSFSLRFSITAMARGLQYVVLRLPTRASIESDGNRGTDRIFKKVVVATSHLDPFRICCGVTIWSRDSWASTPRRSVEGMAKWTCLRFLEVLQKLTCCNISKGSII